MSNTEGETTAITVFSSVKTWGRFWLPVMFAIVRRFPSATSKLRHLSFIHFARWSLVHELPHNGDPQPRGEFPQSRLYFESNFNGGWGEYIDAFSYELTRGMRAFWGSSVGFPGAIPTEPFKAYIRAHESEAAYYFSAYPAATSTMIQRALKLAELEGPPAQEFMAMTPIAPGATPALRALLRSVDPLRKLPATHMGRLVVVADFEGLDYLVFSANFDGDPDAYLSDLVALEEAPAIWAHCFGATADLKAYLLHNQIHADVLFTAYNATVAQVLEALAQYPAPDDGWVSNTPAVRLRIGRGVRIVADTYARDRAQCPAGSLAKRDQHADEYGTLRGRLRVAGVPTDMRHGLFARNAEHDVVARFSPNAPVPWPLCAPVGIGIKIGDVQDLLGGGVERFFCKNAADAVDLVQARAGHVSRFFFPSLNPRRWRLLELWIMAVTLTRRARDLFGTAYFSQTTIGCGDLTVKWMLRPQSPRRRFSDPAASLRNRGAAFTLCLQRVAPAELNDPRKRSTGRWDSVGTLSFPAQEPGSGEHLSISVGHCDPAHEPRDEIGEFRAAVYDRISRMRHSINHR